VIRQRHVFYVEGYDPLGTAWYYDVFRRSWERFCRVWQVDGKLEGCVLDSELIAHWNLEAAGPNWQVVTRYEFLRLEAIITARMAQPIGLQMLQALAWSVDDLLSGTTARIVRAAWRFGVHLILFQILLVLWLLLSLAGGALAGFAAVHLAGFPTAAAAALAFAAAIASFLLLRPLADRWLVVQIGGCWPLLRALARGKATPFDSPIDHYAERVVAAARSGQADEIVVVGHSAAGVTAPAVMARALELDPDLGSHGPQMVLLTLGSVLPAAALHPSARKIRAAIARLADEPSITWIDCVSRKDAMNFWSFDLVGGTGVEVGARHCNPLVWAVRFKDSMSPEHYKYVRRSFYRVHFQFIKSGDRRGPFDYLMLVAGPLAIADWARQPDQSVALFAPDGGLIVDARASAAMAGARG
jgi:hypothetical protein